jgi:murein DD-endopeptidase MepM/ murein hydrolase activator NlpD
LHATAIALIGIGLAACSGDVSRFGDNSSHAYPDTTGSIPPAQAAPAGRIESQPLPPQTVQVAPAPAASTSAGIAGGGRGMASYTPATYAPASVGSTPVSIPSAPTTSAARPSPAPADVTGTVAAHAKPAGHWAWDGGKRITVAHGDTIDGIARRYGVPPSAIMQANNIAAPATIHPGQQLVIPRYVHASAPSAAAPHLTAASAAKPAAASAPGTPGVHVVAAGETLSKISRLYGKPVGVIAKANKIQPTAKLNIGDRLVIPGVRVSAKPQATPAVAQAAKPAPAAAPVEPEPVQSASMVAPVAETQKEAAKPAEAVGALPKFRWPANGRVIAAYGPTTNGQQNDGINIALPENTPVKAAEDGVVAYAGNELKGYGNLVLVRHPNGYVTAYAHAKELLVKRGDQVKRGQMIARSGQTGNVNAPQLHFEIRKGATPLDPTKFLNGA